MRKISIEAADALKSGQKFSKGNTTVRPIVEELLYVLSLFGNEIAEYDLVRQTLTVSSGGWQTATTKERLNAVFYAFNIDYSVYQRKGKWYVRPPKGEGVQWNKQDNIVIDLTKFGYKPIIEPLNSK